MPSVSSQNLYFKYKKNSLHLGLYLPKRLTLKKRWPFSSVKENNKLIIKCVPEYRFNVLALFPSQVCCDAKMDFTFKLEFCIQRGSLLCFRYFRDIFI